MYSLKNDLVCCSLDDAGRLVELNNLQTGTDYAGGGALWRLIYQDGVSLEEELAGEAIKPEITQDGQTLNLKYTSDQSILAFVMEIKISLVGDELHFDLELENKDEHRVIRECFFPMIKACRFKDDQLLYLTIQGGQRFKNIRQAIAQHHTLYKGLDNHEIKMSNLYPGGLSMNYYLIASDAEGLYFGSHDDSFQVTNHFLAQAGDDVHAAMVKYPYLQPGETVALKDFVLSPYSGSWHVAAKKYRSWADNWFTPHDIPEHIREMTSWQRVILRNQYGSINYRYDQLEEILKDGKTAEINTLFMFGWHQGGHDAEYPDYRYDETQGGFQSLKENIRKFQDGGGKVLLYFNGKLIDMATDFYRETGSRICVKRSNGSEYQDFYPFGGKGTALRLFGNKSFVTACPSSPEWLEVLKGYVDIAVDLDCDGVFFDQLGIMPGLCFDPGHGHHVPFVEVIKTQSENIKKLKEYAVSRKPGMSVGIELLSDVTARYADYVHSVLGGTWVDKDWQHGEKPESHYCQEMFYYTFPEVILSDREIRDDTDIERRVNLALLKGLRSDVEIYRCRATITETPHYQAYLAKANALREKYADLIMNGRYSDTDYFEIDSPEFFASSFTAGDKLAVLVTQSHLDKADAAISVPGYRYLESDGLNDYRLEPVGENIKLNVSRHGLVVIVLEKIK